MTTTTVPRTITTDDIGSALARQWAEGEPGPGADDCEWYVRTVLDEVSAPLVASAGWTLESGGGSAWEQLKPPHAAELALWQDLRPSEAVRLMELVDQAFIRAVERCRLAILEELALAGEAFAEEHPDAKRNTWTPPAE